MFMKQMEPTTSEGGGRENPMGIFLVFSNKKDLTNVLTYSILSLAVGILWRCTQEAEEVPLLRV